MKARVQAGVGPEGYSLKSSGQTSLPGITLPPTAALTLKGAPSTLKTGVSKRGLFVRVRTGWLDLEHEKRKERRVMGWRMLLLLSIAVVMAVAAMASLFSVKETTTQAPPAAKNHGMDSDQGIREESREALRDVLRQLDDDGGKSQ